MNLPQFDYDLITIGAGSGGVRASRLAAQTGARVAVVEESRVGGTCVLRGCVPKKLLVYAGHFADDFEDAAGYGWNVSEPGFDWPRLIAAKDKELDRLNNVYLRILGENKVDLIDGRAVITGEHSIEVAGKSYSAKNILVAVGGWPSTPEVPGIEHVISSNEALDLKQLPKRIVIVGAGYIAVEFAGIFNSLGVDVTLVLRADTILRGFDDDIRMCLADEMEKRGITVKTESVIRSIEKQDDLYSLRLAGGEIIETDLVMYATGRTPNTAGLGLEEVGVELNKKGAVVVDAFSSTAVDSIWAVGDVTDRANLTPVAIAEGVAFVETVFKDNPTAVDHGNIPTAVFSSPPIGTVGLTEQQAREQYGDIDVYVSRFRPMKYTLSGRDEQTFMKLIVDAGSDVVIGCHMMGLDAPEIIQGLGIAIKCGATKAQFDATVGIHPSAAEEFVTMREKRPDHEGPSA
ncbi:MAG: glutathione-disulfide reductase [Rhodospirillaceae bacterium]|nr:glutathione-disulfide reductase [Rhodospirillaceae bacterium]MBT5242636.1 glutathione-disulfide reductase [Rhodospirillaceae bacterium]MBT5562799.1 glutathione-disulfide reductase [Rhodospirillaceae bacterium]MBT6241228.1 glutathione-disulfide reductase [Rhodospirillaceae bacterium]MBT7137517.1 glutathione-disulfide reductase [Rhodospirillaceae bacterium]